MKRFGLLATILFILALGACASHQRGAQAPPAAPAKTEIFQWQAMKLLADQSAVQIVLQPPADLRIRVYSHAETVAAVGGGIAGGAPFGFLLGIPILIADAPWLIAHERSESQLEERAQTELSDPALVVREKLLAALREEPRLGGLQWTVADCAAAPCPQQTAVSIVLRTTRREVCDGAGKTQASWSFYAAEMVLSTSATEWGTACLAGDPQPPSASAPMAEIQKHFDHLASACAEQLVTALLGRGKALPSPAPPWTCS